jgi:hypothetical protein
MTFKRFNKYSRYKSTQGKVKDSKITYSGDSLAAAGEEGGSGPSSRHQDGNAAAVVAEVAVATEAPVAAVALPAAILAKEKLLRVS